jgi:hypothetical protein
LKVNSLRFFLGALPDHAQWFEMRLSHRKVYVDYNLRRGYGLISSRSANFGDDGAVEGESKTNGV